MILAVLISIENKLETQWRRRVEIKPSGRSVWTCAIGKPENKEKEEEDGEDVETNEGDAKSGVEGEIDGYFAGDEDIEGPIELRLTHFLLNRGP